MEGIPKIESSLEKKEEDFLRLVQTLPSEMAQRWQDKYDDLLEVTDDFFAEFNLFLKQRRMLTTGAVEIYSEASQEIINEIQQVTEKIIEVYENPVEHKGFFLGDGRTAKVYALPVAPSLCVKYIYYESPVDIPIAEEVEILGKLKDFSLLGIRTPVPYFKQVQPGTRHFYGMERISGKNLFQIVNDPSKNKELIKIAKTMDMDQVVENLTAYVDQLYRDFRVTHCDLRQSNIMLGYDGQIYVIDFGKSKCEEVGQDIEESLKSDKLTLAHEVREFFKKVDKLEID